MKKIPILLAHLWIASLLLVGSSARAEEESAPAFDNATVQPAGPRMGPFGKIFFNMEGNQNANFASFGVADFNLPDLGEHDRGESLNRLTLTFVQANASFTHDGELHFWLTTDTTTDIQPSTNPAVRFIRVEEPDGLGQQLTPRFFLGSGMFVQVGDEGRVDSYSFRLSGHAKQYLRRQIESGGNIRIIVSPADATVAATYAGFSNPDPDTPGPVLTINSGDD